MNIRKLELKNFKKFADLEAEFSDGVNLFVGVNGGGKTSLLEAINVAVGAFFGSQESKMRQVIEYENIKVNNGLRAEFASVSATSDYINGGWKRTIKRDTKTNDSKEVKNISDYGKGFFEAFEKENDDTVAPIIAYYSTQRLFSDAKQSKHQLYDSTLGRRNGYLQALKVQAIKPVLHEWLHNATFRQVTREREGLKDYDLVLKNVETVIKNILAKFWKKSEGAVKIYFNSASEKTPFLAYGDIDGVPFMQLSDGLRNLLYLVIDLVWRASQLNPFLSLDGISAKVNGVVTIDEIDLHLHPQWQGIIVKELQLLLPKVQFFITTHSPMVVANFENGTLYTVNGAKVNKYEGHYFGRSVEDIIREVLEARPRNEETQHKIDQLLLAIDENNAEKYNLLLRELEAQLGPDDTQILRAQALIDWKNSPD